MDSEASVTTNAPSAYTNVLPRARIQSPPAASELLANAANAIFVAWMSGVDPFELRHDVDIVTFCDHLAEPRLDCQIRKFALQRVAAVAHQRVNNTQYVKNAQSVLIKLLKMLF